MAGERGGKQAVSGQNYGTAPAREASPSLASEFQGCKTRLSMNAEPTDHFLSENDLDLRDLSWDELLVEWNAWLLLASATDADDPDHEHGVFVRLERN